MDFWKFEGGSDFFEDGAFVDFVEKFDQKSFPVGGPKKGFLAMHKSCLKNSKLACEMGENPKYQNLPNHPFRGHFSPFWGHFQSYRGSIFWISPQHPKEGLVFVFLLRIGRTGRLIFEVSYSLGGGVILGGLLAYVLAEATCGLQGTKGCLYLPNSKQFSNPQMCHPHIFLFFWFGVDLELTSPTLPPTLLHRHRGWRVAVCPALPAARTSLLGHG